MFRGMENPLNSRLIDDQMRRMSGSSFTRTALHYITFYFNNVTFFMMVTGSPPRRVVA
jgi:hypothetical protein